MLNDNPADWVTADAGHGDAAVVPLSDGRLAEITAAVARATGCDAGVIYRRESDLLVLVAGNGPPILLAPIVADADPLSNRVDMGSRDIAQSAADLLPGFAAGFVEAVPDHFRRSISRRSGGCRRDGATAAERGADLSDAGPMPSSPAPFSSFTHYASARSIPATIISPP